MSGVFKNYGEQVAAVDEWNNHITYSELFEFSEELWKMVQRRCLVFSLCTNTIGSLAGYVAFQDKNIVPLLLSDKLDKELYEFLVASYHPEYIWIPKSSELMKTEYEIIYEKFDYILCRTRLSSFILSDELALLLTTSGSTGSPKLVRQSYKNIQSNTESIVEYLELDSSEKAITTLPMNYTYGLSIVNTHLYVGATLLLTDKALMQKDFWEFFNKEQATSFGGVPYTYEMLEKLRFFNMQLPSLRYMTQAGGKLTPKLHKLFAEYAIENGKKFIVMYGQTEATARMSYLPYNRSLEKYGSVGIAIPGGMFELIDVKGEIIETPDMTGELVYKGNNVTLGYAETGEDLSKGDERHGVLVTGDMAKRDEDGFYYIVGRKKRFLKIYGNRVNLDEVEKLLKTEYHAFDCACSGVDDKLYVFITNSQYSRSVKKFIAEKTGINMIAFKIVVVDEIPKNDAGKTLYREMNQYIEGNCNK
ncbi:MAG: AMP-binding protein [Lachnospiraceae bacterium]